MAEKPILFSTEMVKAILDGRKTMTRRVIKNPERLDGLMMEDEAPDWAPYAPGDVLWVRETWRLSLAGGFYIYKADPGREERNHPLTAIDPTLKWKRSIHMPRIAARLFLRVKSVRVERLQAITRADALAEGVEQLDSYHEVIDHAFAIGGGTGDIPRQIFRQLWDSLNAKKGFGWNSNCWVWVVEFSVVNADAK